MGLAGLLLIPGLLAAPGEAERPPDKPFTFREVELPGGPVLRFAVQLPPDFDPERAYPVVLAFPPGPQTLGLVDAGMTYWEAAARRGWVVISPEAPGGTLFFLGSEVHVPAFLDLLEAGMNVEGGCFHAAGASNGGRAAFRAALDHPQRFCSVTGFPGHPPGKADMARLERLSGIPVTMWVGEHDEGFLVQARRTRKALDRLGIPVTLRVFKGEGHNIRSLLGGVKLMDLLDGLRDRTVGGADGQAESDRAGDPAGDPG